MIVFVFSKKLAILKRIGDISRIAEDISIFVPDDKIFFLNAT